MTFKYEQLVLNCAEDEKLTHLISYFKALGWVNDESSNSDFSIKYEVNSNLTLSIEMRHRLNYLYLSINDYIKATIYKHQNFFELRNNVEKEIKRALESIEESF